MPSETNMNHNPEMEIINEIIKSSLDLVATQLKNIFMETHPFPSVKCGIKERNLTHAFAHSICTKLTDRHTDPHVYHEMPLINHETSAGNDISGRNGALDTVIFNDKISIFVEAKQLHREKQFNQLQADWARLAEQALPSFLQWRAPNKLPPTTVVRMLLADYWVASSENSGDDEFIVWWNTKGSEEHNHQSFSFLPRQKWWSKEPSNVISETFGKLVISKDQSINPRVWGAYAKYYILATWTIAEK